MNESKMMVSICMITYGHEKYIPAAIDGILMQKIDFEYELIISNDCSPDNTDTVVQNYIDNHTNGRFIKYFSQRTNIGAFKNFLFAFEQAKGKYIAICEGDDYWTDPLKLQKQVAFLESNLGYSFCTHRYKIYSEFKAEFDKHVSPVNFGNYPMKNDGFIIDKKNFHKDWLTQPLTAVIRSDALNEVINLSNEFNLFRDFHFFYLLLGYGKAFCMEFIGGVYRLHEGGIHAGIDKKRRLINALSIYKELYFFSNDKRFMITYCKVAISLLNKGADAYGLLKTFIAQLNFYNKIYFIVIFFVSFYQVFLEKLKLEVNHIFNRGKVY
jgi:glycosyltransferase involved in cell wall biosynthesis